MKKNTQKFKMAIISAIVGIATIGSSFATGTIPSTINVPNVNNGDVLVKDIINNLSTAITSIYNYLKGGFVVEGDMSLKKRGHDANFILDTDRAGYIKSNNELRLASKSNMHFFIDSDNNGNNSYTWNSNRDSFNSPIKRLMTLYEDGTLVTEGEIKGKKGIRVLNGYDMILSHDGGSSDFGIKADGENLSIREPEDHDKEYFRINDDNDIQIKPSGNLSLQLYNSTDAKFYRTLWLRDWGGAGSKNLVIGDDTYLTDIDKANMLGIYGYQNSDRAGIRLGSDGTYLWGDNGRLSVNTTSSYATFTVNGDGWFKRQLMIRRGNNYHYGRLGLYRGDGKRGLYIGRGNGNDEIEINNDYASKLKFDGGGSVEFYNTPVMHKQIEIRDTSTAINQRYDSDRLLLRLRHDGGDNNPIELRTEDVNDDGIILTSNGHEVAKFKKSWTVIDSRDISLKATGTNKGIRIKSDGSVCIGSCW